MMCFKINIWKENSTHPDSRGLIYTEVYSPSPAPTKQDAFALFIYRRKRQLSSEMTEDLGERQSSNKRISKSGKHLCIFL